jgi:hypothetical protein
MTHKAGAIVIFQTHFMSLSIVYILHVHILIFHFSKCKVHNRCWPRCVLFTRLLVSISHKTGRYSPQLRPFLCTCDCLPVIFTILAQKKSAKIPVWRKIRETFKSVSQDRQTDIFSYVNGISHRSNNYANSPFSTPEGCTGPVSAAAIAAR